LICFFVEMKMIIDNQERWSLLSIGAQNSIDIKFVQQCQRSYAFSVDSAEIVISPLLSKSLHQCQDIFFESLYGNAPLVLRHINSKYLKAKQPERIRRGIFRFCLELAKGRTCETEEEHKKMQSVFTSTFLEEFQLLPKCGVEEFHLYLEKFLSKHRAQALETLLKLFYILTESSDHRAQPYLEIIQSFYQKLSK